MSSDGRGRLIARDHSTTIYPPGARHYQPPPDLIVDDDHFQIGYGEYIPVADVPERQRIIYDLRRRDIAQAACSIVCGGVMVIGILAALLGFFGFLALLYLIHTSGVTP